MFFLTQKKLFYSGHGWSKGGLLFAKTTHERLAIIILVRVPY
jgi:hypothetical protein